MNQKAEVSHDPALSFLGIYMKVSVTISQRCIYIHDYYYTSQYNRKWSQPSHPSIDEWIKKVGFI